MPRRMSAREIVEDLKDRIESGEYPPGAEMPSYKALASMYDVSYATAHRVYMVLGAQGLVRGEPGRGTFVEGDV